MTPGRFKLTRPYNCSISEVKIFRHQILLGTATGFVFKLYEDFYFVTNWHVVTGRSPITGGCLHSMGALPDRIEFSYSLVRDDNISVQSILVSVDLKNNNQAAWYQGLRYKNMQEQERIPDVAVIKLENIIERYAMVKDEISFMDTYYLFGKDQDKTDIFETVVPPTGSEIYVVGFPENLFLQGKIPIWKRASIASEPLIPVLSGDPVVLIDSLARKGMSGSPILYRGYEAFGSFSGEGAEVSSRYFSAIGVYSGREGVTENELDMSLGRMWPMSHVVDIILNGVSGEIY